MGRHGAARRVVPLPLAALLLRGRAIVDRAACQLSRWTKSARIASVLPGAAASSVPGAARPLRVSVGDMSVLQACRELKQCVNVVPRETHYRGGTRRRRHRAGAAAVRGSSCRVPKRSQEARPKDDEELVATHHRMVPVTPFWRNDRQRAGETARRSSATGGVRRPGGPFALASAML